MAVVRFRLHRRSFALIAWMATFLLATTAAQAGFIDDLMGTTYSWMHSVGADLEPEPGTEYLADIFDPALPGASDDVVTFDGIEEAIRTNILGTVPLVTESVTDNLDGTFTIRINSRSQGGEDLFPGGQFIDSDELTDAVVLLGETRATPFEGDPFDLPAGFFIQSATLKFIVTGVAQGSNSATSFFAPPWDGVAKMGLPDGAGEIQNLGQGFDAVELELIAAQIPEPSGIVLCLLSVVSLMTLGPTRKR